MGRGGDTPGMTPGCRDGVVGTWRSLDSVGRTQILPMTGALAYEARTGNNAGRSAWQRERCHVGTW